MATCRKRFTVSLTDSMEDQLDKLKQKKFYNDTQSEMVRYLLDLGLQSEALKNKEETLY